ncbi:MAG: cysteine hydrolase [Tissierellia bacterium]|jgi:nicotinamidase-related amidase|nr:cysteine hydrolase [Tissierellia bacterium]HKM00913.1 isochorismatase family cysteine hydrolase [Sedimentibacter sp.]
MDAIKKIESELKGKTIELSSLDKDRTALFVVDMVNGFVYSGALASPRVAAIVENVVDLNKKMKGYKKVFFLDTHDENSLEFRSFPMHCIKGEFEAELIPELKTKDSEGQETFYIEKNSTNGFHSDGFKQWIKTYEDKVDNYVITGCVTDICVLQFALTLKTYFNEKNKSVRLIVPANTVETYDGGSHDGDLINLFALYNMHTSGIEIVDKIK